MVGVKVSDPAPAEDARHGRTEPRVQEPLHAAGDQAERLLPRRGTQPPILADEGPVETLQAQPAKMVRRAAYQGDRPSQWLAERAPLKAVVLPFTVGGTEGAKDLFGLYDDTIQRLLAAAK